VQARLLLHPRVQLCYGARFFPHGIPAERIWGTLKRHLANFAAAHRGWPTHPGHSRLWASDARANDAHLCT